MLSLRDVLRQWLEHRIDVLVQRSQFRLNKIEHRLEVLDGYLIAYLNIDEVIRIVRFEDDPKAKLIARFKLTEVQADAILNLRLQIAVASSKRWRSRPSTTSCRRSAASCSSCSKSDDLQWERIAEEVKATRERYSKSTELGARRTSFADAPVIDVDLDAALIEKEPITIVLSDKGWMRALKGHVGRSRQARVQAGRQAEARHQGVRPPTSCCCSPPTARSSRWRLAAAGRPRPRRAGAPDDRPGREPRLRRRASSISRAASCSIASTGGYGFIVPEDEVVASTRKGKQVLNVTEPEEAKLVVPVDGDHVAVIGENRKMLVFKLDEVNEMTRGKGVILQRFKDGELADVRVFKKADGLDLARLAPGARSRCHGRSCATGSACARRPAGSCRRASRGPTRFGPALYRRDANAHRAHGAHQEG